MNTEALKKAIFDMEVAIVNFQTQIDELKFLIEKNEKEEETARDIMFANQDGNMW